MNLKGKTKSQVKNFIRWRLQTEKGKIKLDWNEEIEEHKKFDFSGYDANECGDVTIHNLSIINEFSDLMIYDYTEYLWVDFYKGNGVLYLKYFQEIDNLEFDLGGLSTSDIIYKIFEKTIFTDKRIRRRS